MSDLKSENEIINKKPTTQSHTVSKSLTNFDYSQNPFQLNSNNLFAFPEDPTFLEGLPNEENFNQNDTFFLSRNSNFSNLEMSNIFSTIGEKSLVIKQLNEMDKQIEDDNKSNFTIDLDLEKQVESLMCDEDDDLNDAKYLENDKSNWSSTSNINSYFINNQNQHNMTTPMPLSNNILTNQIYTMIESEEKTQNNNILTPANSTIEINKKILGEKNKDKKK